MNTETFYTSKCCLKLSESDLVLYVVTIWSCKLAVIKQTFAVATFVKKNSNSFHFWKPVEVYISNILKFPLLVGLYTDIDKGIRNFSTD